MLKNQNKKASFDKYLEMCRKVHIKIPLLEAILSMPNYARFFMELVSNKRKLEEYSIVTLTEEYSVVL